jgi:hypothetical protein
LFAAGCLSACNVSVCWLFSASFMKVLLKKKKEEEEETLLDNGICV